MRCHFLDSIPGGGLESLAHASAVLLDAAASTTVSELSESVTLGPKTFFRLKWKHQGAVVSPPDVVVLRKLIYQESFLCFLQLVKQKAARWPLTSLPSSLKGSSYLPECAVTSEFQAPK